MDGIACHDQQAHGNEHAGHGHNHRRHDQFHIAEENPHQSENQQHGKRRGNRHLDEHLDAELVLRDGQPGDMVVITVVEAVDLAPQSLCNAVAVPFFVDRQV